MPLRLYVKHGEPLGVIAAALRRQITQVRLAIRLGPIFRQKGSDLRSVKTGHKRALLQRGDLEATSDLPHLHELDPYHSAVSRAWCFKYTIMPCP